MAQCPKCSADVPDDFGLIECGSCGAQLLVHVDGTVEVSAASPDAEADVDADADVSAEDELAAEPSVAEDFEFESTPDAESAPEPVDQPEADSFGADVDPEPEYNFDEPEPAAIEAPAPAGNASPDLSDIAAFGNSEASGGRDGTLRYNLRITGVDTADVREAFREALTDRKFVWDTDEILRSIKDGACEIGDVSSIKAHVLISRLRQLPVEVEWEQYAIHQA